MDSHQASEPRNAGLHDDRLNAADVAHLLGVSRRRVLELATSPGFPSSKVDPSGYRVWLRDAVVKWALSDPNQDRRGPRADLPVVARIAPQLAAVLSLAHEEAGAINDTGVGSDHLMLALLRPECGGIAREVLGSLGVDLEGARSLLLESYGDPLEPHARELQVAPAVRLALAEANEIARGLQDEEVASEHLLVVLIERPSADLPSALAVALHNEGWAIRDRVLAVTEGNRPTKDMPGIAPQIRRLMTPDIELDLARSPAGHDPRARRPWGSAVFKGEDNRLITEKGRLRQYCIDRDGFPVLMKDGAPIHLTVNPNGEDGIGPVTIPEGSQVITHERA